jgi:ABC-type transport system involved in multi-copper enzyme maturation permease subunit|tara:strand:+ start:2220 stop:2924 length:705 start_codon:yes stop_codon:yes gene_type:complete
MKWHPDFEFLRHALVTVAGHRYWMVPALPLLWLVVLAVVRLINPEESISASEAQGPLLAVPMTALAIFLGIRIIASEIDDRSLEIAYTVPGGVERLWFTKLAAAFLLLIASEVLLAPAVYLFFTPFPPGALYGAMQAASFYLILAMAMSTLFRGEAAGIIATVAILALNGLITGFGDNQVRISPFWNPYDFEAFPAEVFAWTLQNRIGMLLAMAALIALAFMRANRRERMLEGA